MARLGELIGFLPADDSGWGLRAGHIFAELVRFYASQGGVEQANELVATMMQRRIPVEQYVDGATLQQLGRGGGGGGGMVMNGASSWGGGEDPLMGSGGGGGGGYHEQQQQQQQIRRGGSSSGMVGGGYQSGDGVEYEADDPF